MIPVLGRMLAQGESVPTGSHYPIGTRIGRSRVTRVTLSKIRLSGGAFRPAEPSAPDGGGVAQAILLMIATMLDDPAQALKGADFKRLFENDAATVALDPGDRPERLDTLDFHQHGSADPRGFAGSQPAAGARDIFERASGGALGQHQSRFQLDCEPGHGPVAQFSECPADGHTDAVCRIAVNIWLEKSRAADNVQAG